MKKLDLHIHTISTISDWAFDFDMETLIEYVQKEKLDCIAITNHNKFDKEQFIDIKDKLENICTVLPGIEINIGVTSAGHLICITDINDIDDFASKCAKINTRIKDKENFIKYDELKEIFPDFNKYLWIPHYDKKPPVDKEILDKMKDYILCGEVGSVKKFKYLLKNNELLTPVFFSDFRASKDAPLPTRYTYFDLSTININSLKICLRDKNKVALDENGGNNIFNIIPDLPVSTGLNVIVGSRSSGKTYLLNEIYKNNTRVKYIKQFDLIEKNPDKAIREFDKKISKQRKSNASKYLKPLQSIVTEINDISLDDNEKELEKYVSSLLNYANYKNREDLFSSCKLYTETKYIKFTDKPLRQLIDSVQDLLNSLEYKDIIEKYIARDTLKDLLTELIKKYRSEIELDSKKQWVNSIISEIKKSLTLRTSIDEINEIDFYDLMIDYEKVNLFNKIINKLKEELIIKEIQNGDYKIQIKKREFKTATDFKEINSQKDIKFNDIIEIYKDNPYNFIKKLSEITDIEEQDYYKYLIYVEYKVLNKYNYEVSGGERAEFKLLEEINDANKYDILLIDEPESSFDNIFLNIKVNEILKNLSNEMPVFVTTHNNNVGYSIKPDYIINTVRNINNDSVTFEKYYGRPSDNILKNKDGKTEENYRVILDCLEAGEIAYEERKKDYEMLKN